MGITSERMLSQVTRAQVALHHLYHQADVHQLREKSSNALEKLHNDFFDGPEASDEEEATRQEAELIVKGASELGDLLKQAVKASPFMTPESRKRVTELLSHEVGPSRAEEHMDNFARVKKKAMGHFASVEIDRLSNQSVLEHPRGKKALPQMVTMLQLGTSWNDEFDDFSHDDFVKTKEQEKILYEDDAAAQEYDVKGDESIFEEVARYINCAMDHYVQTERVEKCADFLVSLKASGETLAAVPLNLIRVYGHASIKMEMWYQEEVTAIRMSWAPVNMRLLRANLGSNVPEADYIMVEPWAMSRHPPNLWEQIREGQLRGHKEGQKFGFMHPIGAYDQLGYYYSAMTCPAMPRFSLSHQAVAPEYDARLDLEESVAGCTDVLFKDTQDKATRVGEPKPDLACKFTYCGGFAWRQNLNFPDPWNHYQDSFSHSTICYGCHAWPKKQYMMQTARHDFCMVLNDRKIDGVLEQVELKIVYVPAVLAGKYSRCKRMVSGDTVGDSAMTETYGFVKWTRHRPVKGKQDYSLRFNRILSKLKTDAKLALFLAGENLRRTPKFERVVGKFMGPMEMESSRVRGTREELSRLNAEWDQEFLDGFERWRVREGAEGVKHGTARLEVL